MTIQYLFLQKFLSFIITPRFFPTWSCCSSWASPPAAPTSSWRLRLTPRSLIPLRHEHLPWGQWREAWTAGHLNKWIMCKSNLIKAFLAWSFRKCLDGVRVSQPHVASDKDLFRKGRWANLTSSFILLFTFNLRFTEINNPFFTAAAQERLIEKKRLEMTVNTNLTSILSCRSEALIRTKGRVH